MWLLTFRYYHAYDTFKAQNLLVNGEQVAEVGFAGELGQWYERGVKVQLERGYNTVVVEKYWGWMYLDYLGIDSPKSAVGVEDESIPSSFEVYANYPNPFSGSTAIPYDLAQTSQVLIELYSITGERITTLVDELQSAGRHKVQFDAGHLASGIYLYRVTAGNRRRVGRITLTQ